MRHLGSETDSLLASFAKNSEKGSSATITPESVSDGSAEHDSYKSTEFGNINMEKYASISNETLNDIPEGEIVDSDTQLGSKADSFLTEETKKSETDSQSAPMKNTITRELVIAFYTAKLFLPGFFSRQFFLIVALVTPFLDFGTDYYNAGSVTRYDPIFIEDRIPYYTNQKIFNFDLKILTFLWKNITTKYCIW